MSKLKHMQQPLLGLRVDSDLDKSVENQCQSIGFFRDDDTTGIKTSKNTSHFCRNVKNTCCNENDFQALKYWWQGEILNEQNPLLNETRYDRRKRRIEMVLLYTKAILRLYPKYKQAANRLFKNPKASRQCFESATAFLAFDFPEDYLYKGAFEVEERYEKPVETCMNVVDELQTALMCSACNPLAQPFMDLQKNSTVFLDEKTCKVLNDRCYDSVKVNIEHVYPFLKVLEPLIRCNMDGTEPHNERHRYLINNDEFIDIRKFKATDIDLCTKVLSFGENLNVSSEGDPGYV